MKHPQTLRAAAFLVLCAATAAPAQQAASPPPEDSGEPIVVTGEREIPGLVVDVARVAQRCIACRRAIRRLQASANRNRMAPMRDPSDEGAGGAGRRDEWLFSATRERNAIVRDPAIENRLPPSEAAGGGQRRDEFGPEVGLGLAVAADDHRNSLRTQEDASRRAGRAIDRVEARDNGGNRFTQNLLRAIEPIVERHRQERRAQTVYGAGDPAIAGRTFPDITDAVIEELDRNHRNLDLLDDSGR